MFILQSPLEPCSLSHEAQGKSRLYFILPGRGKISRGNFGKCYQFAIGVNGGRVRGTAYGEPIHPATASATGFSRFAGYTFTTAFAPSSAFVAHVVE